MSFNLATRLRESRNAEPGHSLCHISGLIFSHAQVDEISGAGGQCPAAQGSTGKIFKRELKAD